MQFEVANGSRKGCALLFRNVQNAGRLRPKLISGELDASLVDASLILDKFQLLVATNIAAEKLVHASLVSRNVNTEILYNLSATRNIGKALTTFGVTPSSTYILAVVMDPTDAKVSSVLAAIEGDEVAAERIPDVLREHADVGRLRELYDVRENELTGGGSLLDAIVTRIAVRDVL